MKNNLNLSNVFRLMGRDLMLHRWYIIIATLATMVIMLLISAFAASRGEGGHPLHTALVFPLVLLGGGILITSIIFTDMHHPQKGHFYMTLPASRLEKLLARFLLSLPGYMIYVCIFFAIYVVFSDAVNMILFGQTHEPPLSRLSALYQPLLAYVFLHSVFFLGAIWFKRQSAIRTALAAAVAVVFFTAVERLAFMIIFHDIEIVKLSHLKYALPIAGYPFYILYKMPWPIIVLTLLCWITAAVRYHEIEA